MLKVWGEISELNVTGYVEGRWITVRKDYINSKLFVNTACALTVKIRIMLHVTGVLDDETASSTRDY
jgi:hypothetical protein